MNTEDVLHVLEDAMVGQRHDATVTRVIIHPCRLLIKDGVNLFTHIYIVEYH